MAQFETTTWAQRSGRATAARSLLTTLAFGRPASVSAAAASMRSLPSTPVADPPGGAGHVAAPAAAEVDHVLALAWRGHVEGPAAGEGLRRGGQRAVTCRGGAGDRFSELRVRAHRG